MKEWILLAQLSRHTLQQPAGCIVLISSPWHHFTAQEVPHSVHKLTLTQFNVCIGHFLLCWKVSWSGSIPLSSVVQLGVLDLVFVGSLLLLFPRAFIITVGLGVWLPSLVGWGGHWGGGWDRGSLSDCGLLLRTGWVLPSSVLC